MAIKIGRYIIENNFDASNEIDSLEWQLDHKNTVTVKWTWPSDVMIKLAAVFELSAEDSRSLDTLIRDNVRFIMITKDIDKYFSRTISEDSGRVYRVFPGKFGQNNDIILLNQFKNNVSGVVYKKIRLAHNITYSKSMFSKYKKALIEISCSEEFNFECALYYTISEEKLRYPLNGLTKRSIVYVAQDEEVIISVLEDYQHRVELIR